MNSEQEIIGFCQYLIAHGCTSREACQAVVAKVRAGWRPGPNPSQAIKQIVQGLVAMNAWEHTSCADPAVVANHYLSGESQRLSLADFAGRRAEAEATQAKRGSQEETKSGGSSRLVADAPDIPPKIGRYKILRRLGAGGMGAVYLGIDELVGVKVAIKVILPGSMPGPDDYERFKSEARVVLALSHPNLVRGYEANFDNKPPYIAMEYVEGQTFDQAMAKRLPSGDLAWRVEMLAAVCDGVASMHAHNLAHRDLKPSNIMVDGAGRVVVMDPGLVKQVGGMEPPAAARKPSGRQPVLDNVSLTKSGTMQGTMAFMPPEQAYGDREITQRCDVYTMGKIAFLTITGQHVHDISKPMALAQALSQPIPESSRLLFGKKVPARHDPKRLWAIIERCLSIEPTARYADAKELGDELRAYVHWLRHHEADELQAREHAQAARDRKVLIALVGAAGISVLFGIFAVVMGMKRNAEREAKEAAEATARAETTARTEAEGRANAEREAAQAVQREAATQNLRREQADEFLACQTLINACDWPAAERRLRAMLERDPSYDPARYALAHTMFNLSNRDCVAEWQYLLEHGSPTRRSEYAFYVTFHREQLDEQTDTSVYEPVLAQITDARYLGLARAMLALSDGAIASKRGDATETKRYYDLCQGFLPSMPESDELFWLLAAIRGYLAWKLAFTLPQGEGALKIAEARGHLETSVARNPDFPMSIFWLADIYRTMGQFDASAVLYLRLSTLMPNWVVPRSFRMACILQRDIRNRNDGVILVTTEAMIAEADFILTQMRPDPRQASIVRVNITNAWSERARIFYRLSQAGVEADRPKFAQMEQEARNTFFAIIDRLLADAANPALIRPEEKTQLEHVRSVVENRAWRQ